MADDTPPPKANSRPVAGWNPTPAAQREARQAAALRANLKRRKNAGKTDD
ncbi:MAG TPA: hypothetical protein VII73_11375 [Caulobacteraceae bacterium]